MSGLDPVRTWPAHRLGDALAALGRQADLSLTRRDEPPAPPPYGILSDTRALECWVDAAVLALGLEAEAVEATHSEVEKALLYAGPAVIRLHLPSPSGRKAGDEGSEDAESRFVVLLGRRGRQLEILEPDLVISRLTLEDLRAAVCRPLEKPYEERVRSVLDRADMPSRRRPRARRALLSELLSGHRVTLGWLLRLPPSAPFGRQLRRAGMLRLLGTLVGTNVVLNVVWILGWTLVGRGTLTGNFEPAQLLAWALLLLTLVPLHMVVTWLSGRLSYGVGALLKKRLLYGALRYDPDDLRRQGVGQLLGKVIESESLGDLALSGGFLALVAVIELSFAAWVVAIGAGGFFHLALLLLMIFLIFRIAVFLYRRRRRWSRHRIALTHDLVERMVGHRTRLAQEARERWHDSEDGEMTRYVRHSRDMDRGLMWLQLAPHSWLILGIAGLVPSFVADAAQTSLAVGLGGMLLAYQAFFGLADGLAALVTTAISWDQVAPIYHAAARTQAEGLPELSAAEGDTEEGTVVETRDLTFHYATRPEPAVKEACLAVRAGERLLLEGPSGGGKSTLAALMIGLRRPSSGLILLGGLDHHSLGEAGWRRRVVAAPQYHENHVLSETFAFNVLMGRGWPPGRGDFEEAEKVCRELGLGELLDRMPGGLLQMVGETGWQLSHGERSRLYIARALLQKADFMVLDESFAALDPENLRQALETVLRRAPALLVIAHP